MSHSMFDAACGHITKSVGSKTLHSSRDLNSAERFRALCIVKRKKPFWFWKKPKMLPTQINLENLLDEKKELPETVKSFTILENFSESPTFKVSGSIGGKIASELNFNLSGSDTVTLTIKLGDVVKTEVCWQTLQEFLQENRVNLSHSIFREVRKSKRTSLCVVLESLSTKGDGNLEETSEATVSTDDKEGGKSTVTVDVTESGSLNKKNTHTFTIPHDTVLAYSCNELSIDKMGFAALHTVVDRLDDYNEPLFLEKAVANDPIDEIKNKLEPLLKADNFEQFRNGCKLILPSMTHESLEALHLLLSSAELSIEQPSEDKSMSVSSLSQIFETQSDENDTFNHLLLHLGFTVEKDKENAQIYFPSSEKESILKATLGLVDALADIDLGARKLLSNISPANLKRLLKMIENQLHGEDTSKKSMKSVFLNDPSTELFLKNIGFIEMVVDDDELLCFPERNKHLLRDVYTVIYVLSMTED
ncbi:uncharacterized protein LOC130642743 [Hydractinia symbiolongicarpus]|uniref:uncharacterized protein LOC130639790 n=1 Tax=Hydractinia symbiolongicarpus TaxID=13093 RepID=UPI00255183E4|nr:uncharacterized protein LOC130639790 [Hydractinia symbiolongicarpus]XP_057305528.1 uncharacterized protein LOC130642743 [Hydractinia symbiolongicarpus]